jgi:dihydroorotate dehydrogenase electron transfer subunit
MPGSRDTNRLRLDDPELARALRPGHFAMIRPSSVSDPLLGRPFALYDVVRDVPVNPTADNLVYLVLGRGTAALAGKLPGDRVTIRGPLGNEFGPSPGGDVDFVLEGIGQTPFLALGRWWLGEHEYGPSESSDAEPDRVASTTLLYGVCSRDMAAGLDEFESAGIAVELATDDDSAGHGRFVTELLARCLERGERPSRVVGCGPPKMLAALSALTARVAIPCDLSLENHMACGFSVRCVCVEGPIFPAHDVTWS